MKSFSLRNLFLLFILAAAAAAEPADAAAEGSKYAPKVYAFGEVLGAAERVIGALDINSDGYYKIIGTGTPENRVVVVGGVNADILIEDLTLDVSAFEGCAFQICPGAAVTLRLAGENFLKSGGDWAALAAPEGATLTITSAAGDGALSGYLRAVSCYGAAIGGSRGEAGGNITINGGGIYAMGSFFEPGSSVSGGAGIGGGWHGDGGTIVINGGTVSADAGGSDVASIGGGVAGAAGNITITGGLVSAAAHQNAAGIGSGNTPRNANADGKIKIAGGVVKAPTTYRGAGAAIGGGNEGSGGTITITGGSVEAEASWYSTAIGGGFTSNGQNGGSGAITISGGFVTANGVEEQGSCNACIGTYGSGKVDVIDISGGVVAAYNSGMSTAIGPGGSYGSGGNINLSGGTVLGFVAGSAPIGFSSASIGRGCSINPWVYPAVAKVNIFPGSLVLMAPRGVDDNPPSQSYAASGILVDQDLAANGKAITLNTDLTIPQDATLAVPPGYTLNLNGRKIQNNGQILNAGTILNGETISGTGKLVSCDGDFTPIDGDADLFDGFYIAPGKTMTVKSSQTVTVPAGFTATNDGTIAIDGGTLNVAGSLKNRGLVLNSGGTVIGETNSRDLFGTGGTLTLTGGTWTAEGVVPLGDFTIGHGQTLDIPAGATVAVRGRGNAVNNGEITIASGGTLLVYGTLTNNGAVYAFGTLDNKGAIDNFGTIVDYGMFINEQGAAINNNFTVSQDYDGDDSPDAVPFALIHVAKAGTMDNYGVVNNFGTALVDGTLINEADGVVDNGDGALFRVTDGGTFIDSSSSNSNSDSGTSDGDAAGSTDIAKGPVTLTDAAGQVLTDEAQLTLQSDGWVITAPVGTDLSGVALTFSLPDDNTAISPENGSLHDFSGGQAVTYTVTSANGQSTADYHVRLRTLASGAGVSGTLLNTDSSKWNLVESADAGGSVSFTLTAPRVDGTRLHDVNAALGRSYSGVTFTPTVSDGSVSVPLGAPVLQIAGRAPSLSDLQLLSVSRVEWVVDDGSEYFQDIDPPVTYADIHVDDSLASSDVPSAASGGSGGSGCTASAWLCLPAFLLFAPWERMRDIIEGRR
jgi:hypothetical protein